MPGLKLLVLFGEEVNQRFTDAASAYSSFKNKRIVVDLNDQGSIAEETILQKLDQGESRKRAVYRFRGSFFGSFLDKQKRTEEDLDEREILLQKHCCMFFCLDAKEPKDQDKPDRSARFALPAPPSVRQRSLM